MSTIAGGIISLISGYFGGTVDLVIQRIVDAWQSIPQILFVLTIVTVLSPSVVNLIIILGIIFTFRGVRLKRSGVLRVKAMTYIDAARAMGASHSRIIGFHVLPNVMYLLVISASLAIGQVITTEATLGFLGFGVPPPDPTWGQMLSGSARRFMTQAPWMALAPGIAITLAVLAFNVLGDALRDVMDPRLRGSR
jgi:peptide/nickel transport system permease protein